MKISVEFKGDETRIILTAQENAEEHILGLIYTHKQLVDISHDYKEDGLIRPFNASPNRLKLVLKAPPPESLEEVEESPRGNWGGGGNVR